MRLKPRMRTIGIGFLIVLAGLAVAIVLFLRLPWIATEAISFQNGDVNLVGTLAVPRWHDGPYSAAVAVHGSGGYPRWVHWLWVRRLVPHGMAMLIYDKRGVGDSSGTNPQDLISGGTAGAIVNIAASRHMINLLAEDAMAGVERLKTHNNIDSSRIGFVGISQAGWIMPLAAGRSDDVKFIVSISGPAVSIGLENMYSDLTGDNPESPYRDQKLSDEEIEQKLREYDGPSYYDPAPVLANLKVPTLWVLGGRDRSVPTSWSVANLERLIADGAPFDLRIYPDGDHTLRRPNSQRRFDYWKDVRVWLVEQGVLPR